MPVTATGLSMNITSVQFVYTAPGAGSATTVTLPEVVDLTPERGGTPVFYAGGAAPGPTAKKVVDQRREVKITLGNRSVAESIPQGIEGTLTWNENDLKNGESIGALQGQLLHCSLDNVGVSGKHNEIRSNMISFSAIWGYSAGVYTDPLSYTVVAS